MLLPVSDKWERVEIGTSSGIWLLPQRVEFIGTKEEGLCWSSTKFQCSELLCGELSSSENERMPPSLSSNHCRASVTVSWFGTTHQCYRICIWKLLQGPWQRSGTACEVCFNHQGACRQPQPTRVWSKLPFVLHSLIWRGTAVVWHCSAGSSGWCQCTVNMTACWLVSWSPFILVMRNPVDTHICLR